MIAEPIKRAASMTVEEFLNRPETLQPMEYDDGEVLVFPMPVPRHQTISVNITVLLKSLGVEGKVFHAPVDVKFSDDNVYQPDVLWIKKDGRCVVGEKYLEGAPDLVIEIASPSTERRDRGAKLETYEREGVTEYWLVSASALFVEVLTLKHGKYERLGIFSPEESFDSPILENKTISVAAIFAE